MHTMHSIQDPSTMTALPPAIPACVTDSPVLAIIQVKVKDSDVFMQYVKGHLPTVAQYGGKFLIKAEAIEPLLAPELQGASDTQLFIIQEWPSRDAFNAWWESPEYKPWNKLRAQGADVMLTLSAKLDR